MLLVAALLIENATDMLPIMMTVMLAKWSADAFGRESIYDEHILMNEYPFLDNKWEPSFKGRGTCCTSGSQLTAA